ncbi:MAG: DUF2927 domain-containing protein, partial [Octadecabacter sp.]
MGKLAGGICGKVAGLAVLLTLTACTATGPLPVSPSPQTRPSGLMVSPPAPEVAPRFDASRDLSVHFQRVQNALVARGLLRTDGGGPDTTYTDTVLARNFVRIALFDEFVATPTGLRAQPTISRLRRWEQPVRFVVEFGATVPEDQRREDIQSVG